MTWITRRVTAITCPCDIQKNAAPSPRCRDKDNLPTPQSSMSVSLRALEARTADCCLWLLSTLSFRQAISDRSRFPKGTRSQSWRARSQAARAAATRDSFGHSIIIFRPERAELLISLRRAFSWKNVTSTTLMGGNPAAGPNRKKHCTDCFGCRLPAALLRPIC